MGQDVVVVAEQVIAGALAGGAPSASVSVATASGTTVPILGRVMRVSMSAVTTSGICTLATGATDGQTIVIINESTNNFIVTGNMLNGLETVSGTRAAQFVWSANDTKWAKCV